MATVLDLFQSKNLTSLIKDFEDIPPIVVISKGSVTQCNISSVKYVTQRLRQCCVTRCRGHADCLATSRKIEDASTFLATCNETFCCVASCKQGMSRGILFANLSRDVASCG